MVNDRPDLAVSLRQGMSQRPRYGFLGVEGSKGGPEDSGGQLGEEQRHLVAARGDQVTMSVGHSP